MAMETIEIPDWFLDLRALKDLPETAEGFLPVSAIRIDTNRNGWLDPFAVPLPDDGSLTAPLAPGNEPVVFFSRDAVGWKVSLCGIKNLQGFKWQTGPVPGLADGGLPWLPIAAFTHIPGALT